MTVLPNGRRMVIALIFSVYAISVSASPGVFENTAIVRSVELGGSIVHVTTTYAVKALEVGQTTYRIALGSRDKAKTSWMEGKIKGQKEQLKLEEHAVDSNKYGNFMRRHHY
jgi:oligosaccharyltransferase complex subunit alpha (ribophorin I)